MYYSASELTTTEGIEGLNDYVVSIQKYYNQPFTDEKLIFSVGVVVDLQFILASCSIFYYYARRDVSPEKDKYKCFRIVGDGVTGHMKLVLDGRKLRFIDKVTIHPKCEPPLYGSEKWISDVAIIHTSFPFNLQPGIVGIIKFGYIPGGAKQLMMKRNRKFIEFHYQHVAVEQLGTNSPICRVMSWGRRGTLHKPFKTYEYYASPKLLLYKVKLAKQSDCEAFCEKDNRFCPSPHSAVLCAYRGIVDFIYEGKNYSSQPCAGTEGSPLICHPPGKPEEADIYGLVSSIPIDACYKRHLPIAITSIETVSTFVLEVVGAATAVQQTRLMILSWLTLTLP